MASLGITYAVKVSKTAKDRARWSTIDKNTMYIVGRGYLHFINFRVPKLTGALRDCGHVLGNDTGANVFWRTNSITAPYMHYQFVGEVYKTNKVRNVDGKMEWYSITKGDTGRKTPSGRMMGKKFHMKLDDGRVIDVKGYTTNRPLHTGPDWVNKFKEDGGKYGQSAVNIQAGRFIYEAYCKTHRKSPVGGYQVYHRWRTY